MTRQLEKIGAFECLHCGWELPSMIYSYEYVYIGKNLARSGFSRKKIHRTVTETLDFLHIWIGFRTLLKQQQICYELPACQVAISLSSKPPKAINGLIGLNTSYSMAMSSRVTSRLPRFRFLDHRYIHRLHGREVKHLISVMLTIRQTTK